ncbi:MAG: hypothetical protein IPN07_06205 [Dehalococcoidia bacterium]|nr:hypothetical protein [Dehalococcoidia bacterium]
MFARLGILFAMAVAIGTLGLGFGQREASAADKVVTLNPTSGIVGTVVTAELFNAPPDDFITVIFKIPGDPILTTGTTDANGYAKFTFTIPYVPGGGTWPVFFTDFKCSCQIATYFTVINSRPTPIPTATPTVPLPTSTPVTPLATATATPTRTQTPAVPVLGTGQIGGGGPGPNLGILALGAMAVVTVLAWFAATRRGPARAFALAPIDSDPTPDYSTDLDLATLHSLRRARPAAPAARGSGGFGWVLGAGLGAIAGIVLLRKK